MTLPDDLLYPEQLPVIGRPAVSLQTTHLSWVLLAGRRVFKLKRPEHFDFVDFSTSARRAAACHDEVRLNRRLAADVYLGVADVVDEGGRHRILAGEAGVRACDHAVCMRRLDERATFAARAEAGLLTDADLEDLATTLIAFFRAAPVRLDHGAADLVREELLGNFREQQELVGRHVSPDLMARCRARCAALAQREYDLLVRRRREGRIREGHGDLRLEHVYRGGLPEGDQRLRIIDCVEFSEDLRCIDVVADLAFLVMDLTRIGRAAAGERLALRVLAALDDHEGLALLDLYAGYRAWVRCKVACLAAAGSAESDVQRDKHREARTYAALADRFLHPRKPGPMVVVCGVIAAGKSVCAAAVGAACNWVVISSDRVRKALAGVPAHQRAPAHCYQSAFDERVYAALLQRALAVQRSGRGVVIDATFRSRDRRRQFHAAAQRQSGAFLCCEVTAPEAELRRRLRAREGQSTVSDAREGLLGRILASWEPVQELSADEYLVVDGCASTEEQVAQICARLPGSSAQAPGSHAQPW